MLRDLRPLFAPRSIAVVGASSRPDSVAGRPLANLVAQAYPGALYPINPAREEISGLRCYPSIAEVPDPPELALIVLPMAGVIPALEACARRGVRAAIVISAGFAETPAEEGADQQKRMKAIAREAGMIVCGPNTIGLFNMVDRIPLTFSPAGDMRRWPESSVVLVTQSGGIMTSLANRAYDAGIGLRYSLSTGNEADLTAVEALEYLAEDDSVNALAALLEATGDGGRFMQLCDRLLELGKPLVLCKIGKTDLGGVAVRSHTGALAGSYAALQSVLRRGGVIEVQDIDDLVEFTAAVAGRRFPAGERVAIVTESGGAGAIAVDRAQDFGLTVPSFRTETADRIRQFLPSFAGGNVQNPFDVTAQMMENPAAIGDIGTALLEDPDVDSLVLIAPGNGEAGRISSEVRLERLSASSKPVLHVILSGTPAADSRSILRRARAPVFDSPAKAMEVLGGLRHFARMRERRLASRAEGSAPAAAGASAGSPAAQAPAAEPGEINAGEISPAERPAAGYPPPSTRADTGSYRLPATDDRLRVQTALAALGDSPTEFDSKQFLASFGLPVVKERAARTVGEAEAAADEIGYPVALKVHSREIVHKTEAGGVALNIKSPEELRASYSQLLSRVAAAQPAAKLEGVLVSQMVSVALELIAGIHLDPIFGPLVIFGLGGIWAEALNDVAMRPIPLAAFDVEDMMDELRGKQLLQGARGLPAVSESQLQRLLLTLSDIAVGAGGLLASLDINPVAVTAGGDLVIVDASLFLAQANRTR